MTTECQRTAPERIYLNIFSENDEPFPKDHEGITWCDSEVGDNDPAYIRSDIADAEIARLQAQLEESRQQTDALFKTGMHYCDKIDALKAQVDALAGALHHLEKEGWLSHIKQLAYAAPYDLRNDIFGGIDRCRAALSAAGR